MKFLSYKTGFFYRIGLICISLSLISCSATTIAKKISDAENIDAIRYPASPTNNPLLKDTQDVDLKQYKSVERRPGTKSNVAIAMAVSGGGYRSANLALGVLLGLEKIQNKAFPSNLLREVDYFSTVSGGGMAVGLYVTRLHNFYENPYAGYFSLQNEVSDMLRLDPISPNPLRMDLMPYVFSNSPYVGWEIEKILNEKLLWTRDGGLREGDIFVSKNSSRLARLPYWVINTTIYQDASLFAFAPDVLAKYQVAGFYHNQRQYYFNPPVTGASYYHMPVSVGLMASMSVPIALPPTTLPSYACDKICYLQLYDGGISDNLGINTALSLLHQDKRKIKVLIVVDSGRDLLTPFSKLRQPPKDMPLTVRLTTLGLDSYRKYIKSHLNLITKKILCDEQTDNIITIYLDLEGDKVAQHIRSILKQTPSEQRYLINRGQQLILQDKTLQAFLKQISSGEVSMGRCTGYEKRVV